MLLPPPGLPRLNTLVPVTTLFRASSSDKTGLANRAIGECLRQSAFSVPGIRCGGCIRTIEHALARIDGVVEARVNLTAKHVSVRWRETCAPPPIVETL